MNLLLIRKEHEAEARARMAAITRRVNSKRTEKPGTCFAGMEKVCTESFTPNKRKADRLRSAKYW